MFTTIGPLAGDHREYWAPLFQYLSDQDRLPEQ